MGGSQAPKFERRGEQESEGEHRFSFNAMSSVCTYTAM